MPGVPDTEGHCWKTILAHAINDSPLDWSLQACDASAFRLTDIVPEPRLRAAAFQLANLKPSETTRSDSADVVYRVHMLPTLCRSA